MAFYRKLKNGKWQYRISYKDEHGKFREVSKSGFKTKTEARIEAEEREARLELGFSNSRMNDSLPFVEYLENWYRIFKKDTVSPVTNSRNLFYIKAGGKYFGTIKISDLSRSYYQTAMNKIGLKYAKSSAYKMHSLYRECLKHAAYEGHVARNPAFNIKITGKPSKKSSEKYLDFEEAEKLIAALEDNYRVNYIARGMCLVAIRTGMRLGEIMALTHEDIDFENHTLSINKSWDYTHTKEFVPAKTENSVREIAMDPATEQLIKAQIDYNRKRYLKTGVRPEVQFVFCGIDFQPVTHQAVSNVITKMCEKAEVKRITFHGLRHTHASILLHKKIPIEYISKRLGHSSITMTLDVYAHMLNETAVEQDQEVKRIMSQL